MKRILIGFTFILALAGPYTLLLTHQNLQEVRIGLSAAVFTLIGLIPLLPLFFCLGVFWIAPGLWLLYGYLKTLLERPPPTTSWNRFWLTSAGLNAAYFLVSTYAWLKWGYPGTPIEPIGFVPVMNPFVEGLPMDGALICLLQLLVAIASLTLALRYSTAKPN